MEGYNGWTNKETWLFNLQLDIEFFYEFLKSLDGIKQVLNDEEDFNKYELAQLEKSLKEYSYQLLELDTIDNRLIKDLLLLSFSKINYREIAENLISDFCQSLEGI